MFNFAEQAMDYELQKRLIPNMLDGRWDTAKHILRSLSIADLDALSNGFGKLLPILNKEANERA